MYTIKWQLTVKVLSCYADLGGADELSTGLSHGDKISSNQGARSIGVYVAGLDVEH